MSIQKATTDQLVGAYIQLRDKQAKMKAEYEASVAKIVEAMVTINNELLARMNADGAESVGTPHGTAYKSLRTSATVADREAFLNFIQAQGRDDLLDARAAKAAIAAFMEETGEEVPGVKVTSHYVVNVRRS